MSHEEFEELASLDALDVLSSDERARLRGHLAGCRECTRAHQEFIDASSLLAASLDPVPPPAEAREEVLAIIRSLDRSVEKEPSGRRALFRGSSRRPWLAATAAVFFLALWGWSELRLRALREELEEVSTARDQADEEVRRLERSNASLNEQVRLFASSGTRTIALSGQAISPSSTGRAFVDQSGRRALFFFHNLPGTTGGQSYQLWLGGTGTNAPQSISVFEVDEKGEASVELESLPSTGEIRNLMLTLEPRGGSPTPTGPQYLAGR